MAPSTHPSIPRRRSPVGSHAGRPRQGRARAAGRFGGSGARIRRKVFAAAAGRCGHSISPIVSAGEERDQCEDGGAFEAPAFISPTPPPPPPEKGPRGTPRPLRHPSGLPARTGFRQVPPKRRGLPPHKRHRLWTHADSPSSRQQHRRASACLPFGTDRKSTNDDVMQRPCLLAFARPGARRYVYDRTTRTTWPLRPAPKLPGCRARFFPRQRSS